MKIIIPYILSFDVPVNNYLDGGYGCGKKWYIAKYEDQKYW